jgi:hypothetical protein
MELKAMSVESVRLARAGPATPSEGRYCRIVPAGKHWRRLMVIATAVVQLKISNKVN